MADNLSVIKKIEGLIAELGKCYKAVQFYPQGHPSLDTAVEKVTAYLKSTIIKGESLSFTVSRNGFTYDDKLIAADNKAFLLFSKEFFARNINKMFFMYDVGKEELISFLKMLTDDAKIIREAGGIEKAMLNHGIRNLWANAVQYDKLLEKKLGEDIEDHINEFEEGAAFSNLLSMPKDKEELLEEAFEDIKDEKGELADLKNIFLSHRELFDLLRAISKETVSTLYEEKLNKIGVISHHLKNAKKYETILKVVIFLASLLTKNSPTIPKKKELTAAKVIELTTPEVTTLAIDEMNAVINNNKEKYVMFLLCLGESCINTLFEYLNQRGDINTRNNISSMVAAFGKDALNRIEQALKDSRWHVVCSAVAAIAKIGDVSGLALLVPILDHPDVRVRREVVKALGSMRDAESLDILTTIIKVGDPDLVKMAIIALGELQFEVSIPLLTDLTKSGILKKHDPEIRKAAIIALGKTGSYKAIPPLSYILKDISFLGKNENDELRILAAKSIGEIGGEEAIKALEIGRNSYNRVIKNICKQMLEKVIAKLNEEDAAAKKKEAKEGEEVVSG